MCVSPSPTHTISGPSTSPEGLGSVRTGATILAATGLLDGRPATTHRTAQSGLAALGAKPMREQCVVHDGTYVTAAGVSAGIDMALWLLGEIAGRERAETVQTGYPAVSSR